MQKKGSRGGPFFARVSLSLHRAPRTHWAGLDWTQKVAQEMEALKPQIDGCPSSCDALRWTGLGLDWTGLDWTGLDPWAWGAAGWLAPVHVHVLDILHMYVPSTWHL